MEHSTFTVRSPLLARQTHLASTDEGGAGGVVPYVIVGTGASPNLNTWWVYCQVAQSNQQNPHFTCAKRLPLWPNHSRVPVLTVCVVHSGAPSGNGGGCWRKDVSGVPAVRAGEPCHVFHHPQHPAAGLNAEVHLLAHIQKSHLLRGSMDARVQDGGSLRKHRSMINAKKPSERPNRVEAAKLPVRRKRGQQDDGGNTWGVVTMIAPTPSVSCMYCVRVMFSSDVPGGASTDEVLERSPVHILMNP